MYSIRQIKELIGLKHTQQVYRFLDKAASVKLRLNDMLVGSTSKGDKKYKVYNNSRRFRRDFKMDCYRLILTNYAYNTIKAQAEVIAIMEECQEYVLQLLMLHAEEYVKTRKRKK